MFAKSLLFSGLVAIASSHIIITNPVPYGRSTLKNAPLEGNGSDFPCKLRPNVYDAEGASNVYAQGSKQQLEFQGTAVHGGGSCQVSVTTDLKPTKDSVWRVIKSIEGGCPAKDQTGNMGDSPTAKVPYTYDYTIPKELAAGNYTLAWTWFNKVGNREMYMNCAPLSVTGNSGSQNFLNSLPEMMVANIGAKQCTVPEGADVQFPFPGTDVDRFGGKTSSPALQTPTGACGKSGTGAAPSTSAAGSGSVPEPTASAAPSAQPSSAEPTPSAPTSGTSAPIPSAPGASVPGGVFITSQNTQPVPTQAPTAGNSSVPAVSSMPVPTSAPASMSSSAPANPGNSASPSSPGSQPAAPVPTGGSSPSPSGGHAAGSACSPEGQWNCIGGKSFQRCASGMWSIVQAMAAGVSCEAGESTDLKMAAAPGKRAMRRALRIRA